VLVVTVTACISGASAALLSPEIGDEQVLQYFFTIILKGPIFSEELLYTTKTILFVLALIAKKIR
jgi:hypothetical protein